MKLPAGDVPVTFSGSGQLVVFVSANAVSDSSKGATVRCIFSGGSGTIPATAMAMLGDTGSMGAGAYASTSVAAGAYSITLEAEAIDSVGVFTK